MNESGHANINTSKENFIQSISFCNSKINQKGIVSGKELMQALQAE